MLLPGWNSLEIVSKIHRFFEIAGIICLALLVVAEICAYVYGHRKDELEGQRHQRELLERDKKISEIEEVQPTRFFPNEKQRKIVIKELRRLAQDAALWGTAGAWIRIYWRRAVEAQPYAEQIAKAFREAGWVVSEFQTLEYSPPLPFTGIHCITRNVDERICQALISGFSRAGVKVCTGYFDLLPFDVQRTWFGIGLLVGPKSLVGIP